MFGKKKNSQEKKKKEKKEFKPEPCEMMLSWTSGREIDAPVKLPTKPEVIKNQTTTIAVDPDLQCEMMLSWTSGREELTFDDEPLELDDLKIETTNSPPKQKGKQKSQQQHLHEMFCFQQK